MISSVSSNDDDFLSNAYANISLIADKAWAYDPEDSYRKLNQSLWVQICKLNLKYSGNGNSHIKRVRDVIPGSRLAVYGNFEYDEEQEKNYKPMDNFRVEYNVVCHRIGVPEPWMLQEVEENFIRFALTTPHYGKVKNNGADLRVHEPENEFSKRKNVKTPVTTVENHEGRNSFERSYNSNREHSYNNTPTENDYDKFVPFRYSIDNLEEMELQSRITSDIIRNLWNRMSFQETYLYPPNQVQPHLLLQPQENLHLQATQKLSKLQNQEFNFCNWQNQQTFIKVGHYFPTAHTFGIMRGPSLPILSPEVPEFYPKKCETSINEYDERGVPLHFFPSSSETCYQEEMFPYNRRQIATHGPTFQSASIPILPHPGVNTIIQHPHPWFHRVGLPLQLQVPVCTPPQPICASIQPICPTVIQRPIQLPEKTIPPSHLTAAPIPVYQRPPELYQEYPQRRKNQGVDFNNLILLTKSSIKTRKTQSKILQQNSNFTNLKTNSNILWFDKEKSENSTDCDSEFHNLENKCYCLKMKCSEQDSCKSEIGLSVNESETDTSQKKRLYRDVLTNSSSTESSESIFEKTYDDLERQAMEQYRASEECLALRYQELERQALEQYKYGENSGSENFLNVDFVQSEFSKRNDNQSTFPENNYVEGECPGFERCNSNQETSSTNDKGIPLQSKITISKPERKLESSNLHIYGSHTSIRSGVITKSLTTMSNNISPDWKDTTKGASGDKNEETETLKRQLILMSALKKKSSTSLLKTSGLKSSCSNSIPIFCQMPVMLQTGGGDEKIALVCSPDTLHNTIFLSNEQLTNGTLDTAGLNHAVFSQQDEEPFSEMDFEKKIQDELNLLSSEIRLISVASGLKDEYHLSERYFSMKIGQHLKQLNMKGYTEENNKIEDYLKILLFIYLSSDPSVSKFLCSGNLNNFKLEIAVLKNWIELKERENNISTDGTNFLEKSPWYENMAGDCFDNLRDLLKRAYVILTKVKKDKNSVEIELHWEEYHNKENIVDDL